MTNTNQSIPASAIESAKSQLGQKETSPNHGPMVNSYLASVGLKPGYAWCMAFVYWCFQQAAYKLGQKNPVFKTAGVLNCWNNVTAGQRITKADALVKPSLIKPGAQFFMDYGHGLGHTGIVERIEGTVLHTIEGNTNDGGSREGDGVYRRTRKISDKLMKGFVNY